MNTLANTQWHIAPEGMRPMTVDFISDGVATITFPNGIPDIAYWAEEADGHFMFQWPRSTSNPNVSQVFSGLYNGDSGTGHWCDGAAALHYFTMSKHS